MTNESELPEMFSTRQLNGEWQVLITMDNMYANSTPTESRWHACQSKEDMETIAASPKAFHESHYPSRYSQDLADSLDTIASAFERNGMSDGARVLCAAAQDVRNHLDSA